MSITVVGAGELKATLTKITARMKRGVARGTTKGAMMVQKAARRRIMKGPKSGRRYGKHRASAPGQPPANDTGNLARSISVVAAVAGVESQALVQVRTDYAAALEFGTLRAGRGRKTRIAERPFLWPSINENRAAIHAIIKQEVAKAVDADAKAKAAREAPPAPPAAPGGDA